VAAVVAVVEPHIHFSVAATLKTTMVVVVVAEAVGELYC
jgi:hypothetical protein